MRTEPVFREFIKLDHQLPDNVVYQPIKMIEFNDFPLGVRDVLFLYEEKIMFVALSDMQITSRVDSYLTNVKFPWEQKTENHSTVGALCCYRTQGFAESEEGSVDSEVNRLWSKSFPF